MAYVEEAVDLLILGLKDLQEANPKSLTPGSAIRIYNMASSLLRKLEAEGLITEKERQERDSRIKEKTGKYHA